MGINFCLLHQVTEIARETEVRMTCSLDGKMYLSVSEPQKCKYMLLLRTPELCTDRQRLPRLGQPQGLALHDREEL